MIKWEKLPGPWRQADEDRVRRVSVPGGWLYQTAQIVMTAGPDGHTTLQSWVWGTPVFVPATIEASMPSDLDEVVTCLVSVTGKLFDLARGEITMTTERAEEIYKDHKKVWERVAKAHGIEL